MQAHPRAKSSPHEVSYFNCFVSMVPSEWERSWGLQFTRHICRCCISNWETQAVRKNTYTDTGTQIEEYTGRLSFCLFLSYIHTHCRCSTVQYVPLPHPAWKCWHIWVRWNWKSLNICVSFYKSTDFNVRQCKIYDKIKLKCGILSTDLSNQEKECAYQWGSGNVADASQQALQTKSLTEP